jgi:5,10-methylenetetrahydrofolate reductase
VPFLTCKHPLDYCLSYADRAQQQGFDSLVVLGGDRTVGPPRCVDHAWQLRQRIREHQPGLTLGGWANPHASAASQVAHLLDPDANAEFYLTQIVSHHSRASVEAFLIEGERRGLTMPGVFGVFFYRSANPRTLATLSGFLPVPVAALTREFDEGASPEEVCARSLRILFEAGARHFYVSNLPVHRAAATLETIVRLSGLQEAGVEKT